VSTWRCRECNGLLTVENDDALMFAVLDHPCVPEPNWLRQMVTSVQKRLGVYESTAPAQHGAGLERGGGE